MANIRWSGIESFKYRLIARWYVSAFYGNDIDVDGVGYYNPSTNPTGHGGPTRPFATLAKLQQDANVLIGAVVVFDSGWYTSSIALIKHLSVIGDGIVTFSNITISTIGSTIFRIKNIYILSSSVLSVLDVTDSAFIYSSISTRSDATSNANRCIYIECVSVGSYYKSIENCLIISSSGVVGTNAYNLIITNSIFINCSNITLTITKPRPSGIFNDYSVIIGTIKTSVAINGKTTGVTIEDFKTDGNYFVKSFSEVDLFGNTSGSGSSVAQLQTIFNNYFSPIYLDTWQDVDFSLKPTASDIVKFGGLSGTYIGALPVGYRFSSSSLYNTYIDAVNSSNLAWDAVNSAIIIANGFDTAIYRSIRISLSQPIIVDPINFFANLVYNSEGTARQGVANQRIDTTPDLEPNNTLNQRVVYDYKLAYSPNNIDALSAFKNFELNNVPYADNEAESMLDDNYDASERQRITIQDFMIEFTLRKIVIE